MVFFLKKKQKELLTCCRIQKCELFLKIESSSEDVNIKKLLSEINQINQIVTAYQIEVTQIKSIENLIFS